MSYVLAARSFAGKKLEEILRKTNPRTPKQQKASLQDSQNELDNQQGTGGERTGHHASHHDTTAQAKQANRGQSR